MPSKDINSNIRHFNTSTSWIDDLTPCQNCGIGVSTNQIYHNNGLQETDHAFEDRNLYCQLDDCTYLYGVFDGHMGSRAADFGLQRMAAEILLGQLAEKKSDEEVKEVVRQAYISVEKSYLDSIDDLLAERASLQCELPDGLSAFEAYQKYPHIFDKLKLINNELSSGTSAVIALVHNKKLYVANVGNSRALLCRTDSNSVLRVMQLSVDHDLKNEDEILRLTQLGITLDHLKYGRQIGNQEMTRCLGNYLVKAGYKEHAELKTAFSEPVISEPEIFGGIPVDESCKFLLLLSAGLYKSLEEVIPQNDVNKYIAQLVAEQFRTESVLNDVAQIVVNKVVQLHYNALDKSPVNSTFGKYEDITLIVRNFNFPLHVDEADGLNTNSTINTNSSDASHSTSVSNSFMASNSATNSSNSSSTMTTHDSFTANSNMDSNRRLRPYVDFSEYYKNIQLMNK